MKVKPFGPQRDKYTIFDNVVLDEIMPKLSPSAWKVLCFIIRKTRGWQKEWDGLSYAQLVKGTGLQSYSTISRALEELLTGGYIQSRGNGRFDSFSYSLNANLEIEVSNTECVAPTEDVALTEDVAVPTTESVTVGATESVDTKQIYKTNKQRGGEKKPPVANGNHVKPKTEILKYFVELSGIAMPGNKTDSGYWWGRAGEILGVAKNDVELAKRLMRQAYGDMSERKLTISSPGSLINIMRSLAAKSTEAKGAYQL